MKQLESREVNIGENKFYIRPMPAFKAANISGELANLVMPILSGLAPLAGFVGDGKDLFDIDVEQVAPTLSGAFTSLSGDKLERVLRLLLISGGNISVEMPGERAQPLSEDLANEIFCEDVQEMFILAFEVVRSNYNGFFKKLAARFGKATSALTQTAARYVASESWTCPASPSSK